MPSLMIAFVLALAAVVGLALLLTSLGVPKDIVSLASAPIVGAIPQIREAIEKRQAASSNGLFKIPSIQGFGFPWVRIVLYGWLSLFAVLNIADLVSQLSLYVVGGYRALTSREGPAAVAILREMNTFVIALPTAFIIGRWIGRRSKSYGTLAVVLVAFLTSISNSVFIYLVTSHNPSSYMYIEEGLTRFVLIYSSLWMPMFAITGLIGHWRGRKQRLTAYFGYLLSQLSSDGRTAIVELAYEEAKKMSRAQVRSGAAW